MSSPLSARLAHLFLLAFASLTAAACDDGPDPSAGVTFGGVAVAPAGGASLALRDGALVVSGIPAAADGGFQIDGTRARIDVAIDPLTIPPGGRFGGRVEAADGSEIASIYTEGLTGNQIRLVFAFAAGVTRARILYKRGAETLFEIPSLPVTTPFAPTVRLQESAGGGEGKAGSVHFIRDGGRYVAVSDSEGSSKRAGGCPGYLILPPTIGGLPPPPNALCVDWVEVQPLDGPSVAGARTSIIARGVSEFTVRSLAAR